MAKEVEVDQILLDQFINHMLTLPGAHLSPSHKELTLRCPFCGDSSHNRSKTSFSVNVDSGSERFMRYQCFRASCGVKGIADDEFFDLIRFEKSDAIKNIKTVLASRSGKVGGSYSSKYKKGIHNVINTTDPINEKKLAYINNRLGLNLTYKDLYRLKINLNLSELLRVNDIKIPENKSYYFSNLSNYGVSFISAYNDYCIIRDISKSQKLGKRYTNINIFDNYENVTKNYCLPTQIDLLSQEPTVINITEGAFDIIGVYYHLNIDRDYQNQIYVAACGAGIVNTIRNYIRQYGLLDVKINIFSDADVPIEKYKDLSSLKKYLMKFNVTVYYNTLEKDFGVSNDKIKLVKSKL